MNLPSRSNPLMQPSRLNPFSEMEDLLRSFGRRSNYSREFESATQENRRAGQAVADQVRDARFVPQLFAARR